MVLAVVYILQTGKPKLTFIGRVMRANAVWERAGCWHAEREEGREAVRGRGGWRKNTHDVRDESGGAERCGGGSGLVEKIDHVGGR